MLPKIDILSITLLVLPLQVACHEHCQQEGTYTTVICLVELPRFQETLKHKQQRTHLRELLKQLSH